MRLEFLRCRRPELLLFGFTLALRLTTQWRLHASAYWAPVTGDMKFYSDWALRIAHGQLFDSHAFYGQPLYAYLLGGTFAAVGFHPALISALQSVLDAITAVLIFRIALLVFAETPRLAMLIGATAALGWALFVPAAAYCSLMISASWVVTAWWFCVWWLLLRRDRARFGEWFSIALFIGAMAMISATILFLLPLLLAGALFRRSPAAVSVLCVGVLTGIAPSWAYNAFVARDPVFLSAHSGINFWIGNNPEANGYPKVPHGLPSEQDSLLYQSITLAESAAGRPLLRSEVSAFWSAKAREYISTNFWSWLGLLCAKAKNFWNSFEYDDLSSITALRDAAIVPPGLHFGLVAALGLPGCLYALRIARARWVVAAVLAQMIALLPVFVNERYRLPAVPGLLLLAAFFLWELARALMSRNWQLAALALALVALSSWFVTLQPPEPALWSLNDYKTARRQIRAGDYPQAEYHLRRALVGVLASPQVAPAIANTFAGFARDELKSKNRAAALAAVNEALRIQPNDESFRALRKRIAQESVQ